MANTDDISEKVADLLLSQTARAAGTVMDVSATVVKGAEKTTNDMLKAFWEEVKENKEKNKYLELEGEISAAEMSQVIKFFGHDSLSLHVDARDVKDFEALLHEYGVLYAKMNMKSDYGKLFTFLGKDREKINNISTVFKAQRGNVTEVRSDLYFNSLAPENVRITDGLDPAEMELFRHYARRENLLFTAIPKDGKYTVVYDQKDEQKGRKTMLHVAWDLTGAGGARVREQVEYRLQGRNLLMLEAEEAQRELYIVSKKNPANYVHISQEDLEIYKSGKIMSTVPRGTSDFVVRCMTAVDALDEAVVLKPEEFSPNLTREEMEHLRTLDLHTKDYEELIEIDKQNDLINLVAMKSGMDNEHNATWGLWDPSVSYSEFSGYEFIMDEDERDARAAEFEHFRDAAYYSDGRHHVQNVHMDERNVDFIIAKAEEKRKAYVENVHRQQQEEKGQQEPVF